MTNFETIRSFPLQQPQFKAPFLDMFAQARGLKILWLWNQRIKRNAGRWQKGNTTPRLRAALRRHERFLKAHTRLLPMWRDKLVWLFKGIADFFPDSAFADINEDGTAEDDSIVLPAAHAFALCDNLPELVQRAMRTFYDEDVSEACLFETVRERFEDNLLRASGYSPEQRFKRDPKIILPIDSKIADP